MTWIARAAMVGAMTVALSAGLPATAAETPTDPASMRVFWGYGDSGKTSVDITTPEYQASKYAGPLVIYTVINTGRVPLTIDDPTGCSPAGPVPAGGRTSCGRYVTAPEGDIGTTRTETFPVTATADGTPLRADLTLNYRFYDVLPTAYLSMAGEPVDGTTLTRFRVNIYPPMPWVRRLPEVVALRSSTFGDLLDPANPAVKDSTCPERRGLTYCEFTAAVKGAPGTTVTETVSLELTDRTGPTNTITASTDVVVPVPPVREPTAWAARDAAWPEPTVDGITIARSTRPSDVFFLSRKCERRLPSTLEDLLTVEPMGACALQWRLTRAATAAALNEAARADLYPAESVQAVVDRTNAALVTGKRKQVERLTRTFEEWNEGRSPR